MIGLEGQTLKSERLEYRLLCDADKEPLAALLTDPAVTEPAGFRPARSTEEFDEFFARLTQYNTGVAILHDGQLIGYFHVNRYVPDGEEFAGKSCTGVGIVIGASFQRRGFGTEALTFMTGWLLGRFDACFADCFTENVPSRRMIEKSGYRYVEDYTMPFEELRQEKTCSSYVFAKATDESGNTMDYQDINAETIDRWVDEGWEWGIPISHEEYVRALAGDWDVALTPTKPVPHEWFGDLRGKRVLGLAAGGGQQMPIFAALGAECTVLDYSQRQLDSERLVAEREGYDIRIVRADMTRPLPFEDGEFDLIFHPVANCYVREVKPIWRECFRVLRPGGLLLSGLDNGINYIVDSDEREIVNALPFDPLVNEAQRRQLEDDDCGLQFSHTLDEQIGGQLEAGFTLLALYEDTNGEGRLHELNIPSFIATLARK